MSYDVFVRFEPPVARERLEACLLSTSSAEINGSWGVAVSPSPDIFVTADFSGDLVESATLSFSYGGPPEEPRILHQLAESLASAFCCDFFDPQVGDGVSLGDLRTALRFSDSTNLEVLDRYADGFHFVRALTETPNGRIMLEAQRFDERSPDNYCSVSCAYGRSGHYRRALKILKRSISEFSGHVPTMYLLALTYLNLGKSRRASDILEKAQRIDPENPDVQSLIQSIEKKP